MITNKEYLIKNLDRFGISEDEIDIILLKGGVDPDKNVDIDLCDRAIFKRLSLVIMAATQNVSEGGYSISWNMEALKLFLQALANELGEENPFDEKPKVTAYSNLW